MKLYNKLAHIVALSIQSKYINVDEEINFASFSGKQSIPNRSLCFVFTLRAIAVKNTWVLLCNLKGYNVCDGERDEK